MKKGLILWLVPAIVPVVVVSAAFAAGRSNLDAAADAPKDKAPDAKDAKEPKEKKPDDAPDGAPSLDIIKKQLEVQWGPLGKTTKHEYDYKSIKFAKPVKEIINVNGTGVESGRIRFPVRVVCEITVKFADGTSRNETKKQTFHFFQDDFKEWTYRFIQNDD